MAFFVDTRYDEFLLKYRCIWFCEKVCDNEAVVDDGYDAKKRNLMYCASGLYILGCIRLLNLLNS